MLVFYNKIVLTLINDEIKNIYIYMITKPMLIVAIEDPLSLHRIMIDAQLALILIAVN